MILPYAPQPSSGDGTNPMGTSKVGIYNTNATGSSDTFTIPHGMDTMPKYANALPRNSNSVGDYSVIWDATNVTIIYKIAPSAGSLSYSWIAVP